MGSIDIIIMPLYAVLTSAISKYQQHPEKYSWEHQESNPWLLGAMEECYPLWNVPLSMIVDVR